MLPKYHAYISKYQCISRTYQYISRTYYIHFKNILYANMNEHEHASKHANVTTEHNNRNMQNNKNITSLPLFDFHQKEIGKVWKCWDCLKRNCLQKTKNCSSTQQMITCTSQWIDLTTQWIQKGNWSSTGLCNQYEQNGSFLCLDVNKWKCN